MSDEVLMAEPVDAMPLVVEAEVKLQQVFPQAMYQRALVLCWRWSFVRRAMLQRPLRALTRQISV